jgi:hypothetical protein
MGDGSDQLAVWSVQLEVAGFKLEERSLKMEVISWQFGVFS